jgi:peptide/nickel transport system permease protein
VRATGVGAWGPGRAVRRAFKRFKRDPLAVAGLVLATVVLASALFAPWLAPYPEHAGRFVDVDRIQLAPHATHLLGTDAVGRDMLSRILFGYRTSLGLAVLVLSLAVPVGVSIGLVAGYRGGWTEWVLMRFTEVFLAIPSLVLALAIVGLFEPSLPMAMTAVAAAWWPWYARLVYNQTRSIRTEDYIVAARVAGASDARIMFTEILPVMSGTVLTKMTLDMGFVILLGSSLGFLGLGAQPPAPDLGTMVAEGTPFLPDVWWQSVFSGLAIMIAVLGFNLVGDGLRDVLGVEA